MDPVPQPLPSRPPPSVPPIRLGFPVKVLGRPGLRSHDSRRWQNRPHLSVSLAYLRDLLLYLDQVDIRLYRMSGQLAPYLTHPERPEFHGQLEECATELAALGDLARELRLRLTLHPGFYVRLGSSDEELVARSVAEVKAAADLLDAMGLGPESVMVVHVGGPGSERLRSRARFVRAVEALPERVRGRLALENDDRHFGLQDVLWIHRRTGIPVVLDVLHHHCLDPLGLSLGQALKLARATWPEPLPGKIHLSSPRTEVRPLMRNGKVRLQWPLPNQHSDFIHPFEGIQVLRRIRDLALTPMDVMVEAKAKDVAVLRLRAQIRRYAPDLAGWVQGVDRERASETP